MRVKRAINVIVIILLATALFVVGYLYLDSRKQLSENEKAAALESQNSELTLRVSQLEDEIALLPAQPSADTGSREPAEYTHTQTFRYLEDYDYEKSWGGRTIIVDKFQGSKPILLVMSADFIDFPLEKGQYYEFTFQTFIFDNGNSFKSSIIDIREATAEGIGQIQEPPYIYS